MSDEIDRLLVATLCRVLEIEPGASRDQAIDRVVALLGVDELRPEVARAAESLRRRGVANPTWMRVSGYDTRVFMATSRPGFLRQLVRGSSERYDGLGQYVTYGDWDTILVVCATDEFADATLDSLHGSVAGRVLDFGVRPLIVHGLDVPQTWEGDAPDHTVLAALLEDFDRAEFSQERDRLVQQGTLLGSRWSSFSDAPYPVSAFVGVSLRGRATLLSSDLVRALRSDDLVGHALVDLYEVDAGRPFHYFLRVACRTMAELDDVTTSLADLAIDSLSIDTTSYVIANGHDPAALPTGVSQPPPTATFDLSRLIDAAYRVVLDLPVETQRDFVTLPELRQLSIVRSVAELHDVLAATQLDDGVKVRFRSALSTFARECASPGRSPVLTGATAEAVTTAEGRVRRFLSKLAYRVLGQNPGEIQTRLRLPGRAIAKLSLGNVVQALRLAADDLEFTAQTASLDPEWIARVDALSALRNRWLHDSVEAAAYDTVEEARRIIVEAMLIAEWADGAVALLQPAGDAGASSVATPEAPAGQKRVFVSHATVDSDIAARVGSALKAFGFDAWIAEWELKPGDSIVGKIGDALGASDVLLVLLSPASVGSNWVNRELNSAIWGELAGDDFLVIPVVIEPCDVPTLLRDTKNVDLTKDFEGGLLGLIQALRSR